jgi:hypothetical protein
VTVPTYGFDPLGLKIAYVIYINSNDSWPYTNAGSRDDLRSACDNFRSNLENIDSETYNSVSDPGTLYLKDSGNIQKDSLVFAQVNTLTDLVNYLIGDVKLYIAGHVTYEITGYYMDGAIGEPIYSNIWHFIGTEKHSAIEIMNVIGDSSWGDIGGCLFGFPAFANDIINQFEQGIKNYLYE